MRALKIVGVIVGSICLLYGLLYAYCYKTTLPIDGVVVDAKTGKPVSKVFVMAMWHMSHANLVDSTGGGEGFGTVTDDQGRFFIPCRNVTAILGAFNAQFLRLQHPLYDFQFITVYANDAEGFRTGRVEGGTLRAELQLTSLADRYSRVEDIDKLAQAIDGYGPEFYKLMRDTYGTRYDLTEIMSQLSQLANRFPELPAGENDAHRALIRHQFRMKKLMMDY